jgi:hypothetical protein
MPAAEHIAALIWHATVAEYDRFCTTSPCRPPVGVEVQFVHSLAGKAQLGTLLA